MKKLINRKVAGFSGITHVLIAIFLLFIILYIKIPFSEEYYKMFQDSWKFVVVAFFTVTGASLLPDLDSARSTARFQLGFLGTLLKTGMVSLSYLFTNTFKMKKDWIPDSQHRCLFHTPFVGGLLTFALWKFVPPSDKIYFDLWSEAVNSKRLGSWFIDNIGTHMCVFLAFCCIYLGVKIITFRVFKIMPKFIQRVGPSILIILCFGLILTFSMKEIKYIGLSIGLGYLFHIFADVFSQGSIPVLWPIPLPWKQQWWWRPYGLIFGKIYTGGTFNMFLNFAFLAADLILLYILFIKGKIA